jgi:hypothetical protein
MKRPRGFPRGALGIRRSLSQLRAQDSKAPWGLVLSVFLMAWRCMGREMYLTTPGRARMKSSIAEAVRADQAVVPGQH